MDWQPIETAPKDTAILIYACGFLVAHYNAARELWIGYGDEAETHILNTWNRPTHWMPLPSPPTLEGWPDHEAEADGVCEQIARDIRDPK